MKRIFFIVIAMSIMTIGAESSFAQTIKTKKEIKQEQKLEKKEKRKIKQEQEQKESDDAFVEMITSGDFSFIGILNIATSPGAIRSHRQLKNAVGLLYVQNEELAVRLFYDLTYPKKKDFITPEFKIEMGRTENNEVAAKITVVQNPSGEIYTFVIFNTLFSDQARTKNERIIMDLDNGVRYIGKLRKVR